MMIESVRKTLLTSLQNPRVKSVVKLRERRHRDAAGALLIEGYHEVALAHECAWPLSELYLCPPLVREGEEMLLERISATEAEIVEVSPQVMEKIAYRQNPDAWLAVAPAPSLDIDRLILPPSPLIIVVEAVEKPGNLGAILRSADAVGADAVIVCEVRTDLFNPNVVRASKGALFTVPLAQAESFETRQWLNERGVKVVAATPAATLSHWDTDLGGGVAIAVGTEKEGLSPEWIDGADIRVSIPMVGKVNSLNVAQAATLLMYEVSRQRSVFSP